MGWQWVSRMASWVEGGAAIVAARPRAWALFALSALALAAIPFPSWLMDAVAPIGLLFGLRLAGRCEGEEYSAAQLRHALEVAVLWGMLLAVFGMLFSFGQDTVMLAALLAGVDGHWQMPVSGGLLEWWFGLGERLSDLALMPYFWFSPAFFGVALALHKGHGWIESEVETTLALIFRPEVRDPLIALWATVLLSNLFLPEFSQVWLGLLVWVLGPPIVFVAYQDIFANKRKPPRKRQTVRKTSAFAQPVLRPVRAKG